ncbi:TIGR02444 family protein [Nisaea denitrificans]|uniref:TIGR02444 family protein n=1 Tax=Nisaea denitrificans TaxID=390877 RepID=UPI00040C0430|nr:TIGR02444 family protein [Nisaea denitrificans]
MSVPDTPFWTYSLATYGRKDVTAGCLALQDRFGLDVNLILLCCWLGSRGTALDRAKADQAVALAGEWANPVIAPLRAVRRHLKPMTADAHVASFHKQLAALELEAEQIQQHRLFECFAALPADPAAAPLPTTANNLALYLTVLRPTTPGQPLEQPLRETLVKLLVAVFPEAAEADIVSSLAVSATDPTI